jgi:predicted PurR-regulated permease PerM
MFFDDKKSASITTSYILMFFALILGVTHGLLAPLLAGMLVYSVVHIISDKLGKRYDRKYTRLFVVSSIGSLITAALILLIWWAISFLSSGSGNPEAILQRMADIIESTKGQCPQWACEHLPDSTNELRSTASSWLREHAVDARKAGAEAGQIFVRIIIGMIIGAMISLRQSNDQDRAGILKLELINRIHNFYRCFRKIIFAQAKISAINTSATAIYIFVVLPSFGIHLPLAKTLVLMTFILGMLPIIGNVISNTMLVVIALPFGLHVAISSLVFLVVLHKLEYFLNAKIIGDEIQSRAWELLAAMLVMESLFGLPGVVLAPILYSYIKIELKQHKLI